MNIKGNLLFILSTFPVFITRSNLALIEAFYILIFFFSLSILNFFFLKFLENKSIISNKLYISIITTYGLDNHLGIFNGLIQTNLNFFFKFFTVIYIPAFLIFILLSLLIFFLILKLNNKNSIKILLVTTLTIMIFNVFDNAKDHKQIIYFDKQVKKKFEGSNIILIFDEMSGLNSLASESTDGKTVNKNFIKLFNKYNFDFYPNIFSISNNTVASISSLINFDPESDKEKIDKFVAPSKNYFSEYNIKQNKLFDNYQSVSVIQNMHLNFCNNSNVTSCYQFNPFDLDIINAKSDTLSKIISIWSVNGSIIGKFTWRLLKQLELIHSTLEPEGEKKFINEIFNYTIENINSKKYDLIFLHVLVPHIPYGFNKKCEYDTKISNLNIYLTNEAKIKQHNIERNCIINLLDEFLNKIDSFKNHKIFILSDHGSRITNNKKSSLSTVFAFKNLNSKTSNRINKKNMHKEFKFLNNE
jgi:hypothetical protein